MTTFTGRRVEAARIHDSNADRHEQEAVRSGARRGVPFRRRHLSVRPAGSVRHTL